MSNDLPDSAYEEEPENYEEEFILNIPDEEGEKPPVERELQSLREEIRDLRKAPPRYEETYQPPAPKPEFSAPPPKPQDLVDPAFEAQLQNDVILKPLETIRRFSAAAVQTAEQQANARIDAQIIPLKAALIRQNINTFKQTTGMDPLVAKRFDGMLRSSSDKELANINPDNLSATLEHLRKAAVTEAMENDGYVPSSLRSSGRAPQYGSGSRSAPPGTKQTVFKPKDAVQREAIRVAREYAGWTDKQISDGIKDGTL